MKRIKLIITLLLIMLLLSCQVFLGPDPDNSHRGIFERIWTDFNETYALMDFKGIDWNGVYREFSPQISQEMTDRELFNVLSNMLEVLDDAHVSLSSPFAHKRFGRWLDTSNVEPFSLDVVKTYLNGGGRTAGAGMFLYGTLSSNPDIGYIFIAGFAHGFVGVDQYQDWVKDIDTIIQALANTNVLIVDVRGNTGGLPSNVQFIASRLTSMKKDYVQIRTKNGPGRNDFSPPVTYTINPASSRYTKPIVLLTNRQTVSGGEWFTLALLSQDHVTHAGGTTAGAFSLGLQRSLINGWLYTISIQKVTDMNNVCYEGIGIRPGHIVTNTNEEIMAGRDRQLEFARDFLGN